MQGDVRTALRTNQAGEFEAPAVTLSTPCLSGATTSVSAWLPGYMGRSIKTTMCGSDSLAPVWSPEIRMQEDLAIVEQQPIQTTLSNDDLDWGLPDGPGHTSPGCGPCKFFRLTPTVSQPLEMTVEWSSADRLWVWVGGSDNSFDYTGLAAAQASPGQNLITMTIPPGWAAYAPLIVRVGLPAGSRSTGGLPGSTDLRVGVRR